MTFLLCFDVMSHPGQEPPKPAWVPPGVRVPPCGKHRPEDSFRGGVGSPQWADSFCTPGLCVEVDWPRRPVGGLVPMW